MTRQQSKLTRTFYLCRRLSRRINFLSNLYKFLSTLNGPDLDYMSIAKSITRKEVEKEFSFIPNHIAYSGAGLPFLNTEKSGFKITTEELKLLPNCQTTKFRIIDK